MAALYSSGRMELLGNEFYAFHVSGGTTEGLLVHKDKNRFQIECLATSLDLKAGQAIDRVGAMLSLPFPPVNIWMNWQSNVKDSIKGAASIEGNELLLFRTGKPVRKNAERWKKKENISPGIALLLWWRQLLL